ncbi:tRNA methyltransferase [Helicobacter vulpis]|uniref:tRNA methyltransferase n=1 Tax=Helicobacter vulpis TaxID=2316076 RepID=UPI001F3E643F|nr:tRNA methyltransferase [Helicobacter vulpis]
MIRLLLLALLVSNLQAKEEVVTIFIPIGTLQEFKNTQEFFKAFKVLYGYMQKSYTKIYKRLNVTKDSYIDKSDLTLAMANYTNASIPLAKALAQHVPLFKEFKPKNQREELFLEHVKDMAMLHALDIIDGSAYVKDTPSAKKIAILTHRFLHTTAWLYAPLFNAHKLGLDVIAYLQKIHRLLTKGDYSNHYTVFRKIEDFDKLRSYEADEKNIIPHKPFRKRLVEDMDNADMPTRIFRKHYGYWAALVLNTICDGEIATDWIGEEATLWDFWYRKTACIDPEYLFDLYAARALPLDNNAFFYDKLKDSPAPILKDHPTMCLSPKYLSAQSQQACQQLFQAQTYNAKDIQEQLRLVRLVSIDESPCVYLDSQNKLQTFKSSNPLCHALQTNLTKDTQ